MHKITLAIILALILLPLASSLQLLVQEEVIADTVVPDFSNPAIIKLLIENLGKAEEVEIYSISGVEITPKGFFTLPTGESTIEIQAIPQESLLDRIKGLFTFTYKIRTQDGDAISKKQTINLLPLEQVIKIKASPITPTDIETKLTITNQEKASLPNMDFEISSLFFTHQTQISLDPKESVQITIPFDSSQTQEIEAGAYVITAKVSYNNVSSQLDSVIDYTAQESVFQQTQSTGFFVKETKLSKTNQGNTFAKASLDYEQNIFTRLFTTFSVEPFSTQRLGSRVTYHWEETLAPQESLIVMTKTNYTLPFILILLIIVIAVLVKIYYTTTLILTKRVSYVKTKGGEFALKVRLHVKTTKSVENIEIEDRLPTMVKLYQKFGKIPDSIDPARRLLKWKIPKLTSGEERVYSYIIYTTLKVFGTFTLPSAKATYIRDGERDIVFSNQASFMADTQTV